VLSAKRELSPSLAATQVAFFETFKDAPARYAWKLKGRAFLKREFQLLAQGMIDLTGGSDQKALPKHGPQLVTQPALNQGPMAAAKCDG
jgi:hypothetical protein